MFPRRSVGTIHFIDVRDTTAAEIIKKAGNGTAEKFSIFLMTARKKQPASHGPSGPGAPPAADD
jgi:hypothetical protein